MADRHQDRPFPTDVDHLGANPYVRGESEPLAELAQLIGQTDLFGTPAEPPVPLQSRANVRPQYALAEEASAPAGLPLRRQRARQEAPPLQTEQPSPVHPLQRYAAPPAAVSEQDHHQPQQDMGEQPADPSRYDDALYGPIKSVEQEEAGDPAYPDDPYAYQRGYDQEPEPRTRSGWLVTVAAVLALAVVGTGASFAYRTFVGSPRSGEPPIIRADNSPTKVVPGQSDDGASKIRDRMPSGGGGERLVSREEAPVDVNSRSGAPLVEIPPLNQNPPPAATVPPTGAALAMGANGTMPNNEPRKIKALTVKGDAAENGGIPVGAVAPAKPDPVVRSTSAPTVPAQRNPSAGGGYLVQVSSQKNEADAHVSYRALQNRFPASLGSRPPVIKRADLGDKGVYYRTMVGPFGSTEEAAQFCGNLKTAGGQCVVQRN